MASVYRRKDAGGAWYSYFRRNKRRYREYIGPASMSKEDAEDILANRRNELRKDEVFGPPPEVAPEVTFSDFADDFLKTDNPNKKSKARDEQVIDMLKVEWRGLNLSSITTKMISDFVAKRLKHRKPATVHRDLTVIKRLFRMAAEWGKLESNPAVTVQKPTVRNNRVRHLEPGELARVMAALPAWLSPIARFAHLIGARRGECLNLTWNDIDFRRGMLTLRETKNGEDRHVFMGASVIALLKALPAPLARSQRVFGLDNTAAVWMRIRRAWGEACGTAKVADFHFHDLRHQAATDLLTLGATLNDVRDFLGHRGIAMTLRYGHLIEDRRKDTARLMDRLEKVSPETATERGTG